MNDMVAKWAAEVGAGALVVPVSAIIHGVARADRACEHVDAAALAAAARALVPRVSHALSFELVAVAELADLDPELGFARWQVVRRKLLRPRARGTV
jgi:hypothetical protein